MGFRVTIIGYMKNEYVAKWYKRQFGETMRGAVISGKSQSIGQAQEKKFHLLLLSKKNIAIIQGSQKQSKKTINNKQQQDSVKNIIFRINK